MFVRKSGPVKLRGKAAEIKCLGEPLLAYWSSCYDETNEQHQQVLYLLQMSCRCEEIIFENKSALAFSDEDAAAFQEAVFAYGHLGHLLWCHFQETDLKKQGLFTCTSKTHAICHSALLSRYLNPRLVWCFIGEDMMSTVQQLTQACTKGNTPLSGPMKSLEHWRIAMHLEWQS
ncbi:unnamed protein product [Cladocopium goreaui]|uniref:Uncharacterized protein n=1 Tax=Cladocopium goreaui TaxID=2562237 RepID=A0A9P1CIF5_9DINO|nr:unnamed protein product [Cladocopium goreaui]